MNAKFYVHSPDVPGFLSAASGTNLTKFNLSPQALYFCPLLLAAILTK